jgi:hypothetical protein
MKEKQPTHGNKEETLQADWRLEYPSKGAELDIDIGLLCWGGWNMVTLHSRPITTVTDKKRARSALPKEHGSGSCRWRKDIPLHVIIPRNWVDVQRWGRNLHNILSHLLSMMNPQTTSLTPPPWPPGANPGPLDLFSRARLPLDRQEGAPSDAYGRYLCPYS